MYSKWIFRVFVLSSIFFSFCSIAHAQIAFYDAKSLKEESGIGPDQLIPGTDIYDIPDIDEPMRY